MGSVFAVIYPLVIFVLYAWKLKSTAALPDFEVVRWSLWEKTYGTKEKKEIIQVMRENFTISEGVYFIKTYGELLKGYDVSRIGKWGSVLIPTASLLRRLMMALVVVFLFDKPVFCVFAFNFILLAYMMVFTCYMPKQSLQDNILDIFNEITVLFVNYHLLCFTNFIDVETQIYVSNSVIILVLGNIIVNFLVIVWDILTRFLGYVKFRYALRQAQKQTKV